MTKGRELTPEERVAAAAGMKEAYIESLVPGLRRLSDGEIAEMREIFEHTSGTEDFDEAVRRAKGVTSE